METNDVVKLPTVGLIVLENNKLLLAFSKNKKAWYLPGGKVDVGETIHQALQREIKEELSIDLAPEEILYYCHISAPAYGESANVVMEQDCFLGKLNRNIIVSNEIEEVKYFDLESYLKEENQVVGVIAVFKNLLTDKLLMSRLNPTLPWS